MKSSFALVLLCSTLALAHQDYKNHHAQDVTPKQSLLQRILHNGPLKCIVSLLHFVERILLGWHRNTVTADGDSIVERPSTIPHARIFPAKTSSQATDVTRLMSNIFLHIKSVIVRTWMNFRSRPRSSPIASKSFTTSKPTLVKPTYQHVYIIPERASHTHKPRNSKALNFKPISNRKNKFHGPSKTIKKSVRRTRKMKRQ